MGVGRKAPHRTRAAYARALAAIPLPVRAISAPVTEALTVLGTAEIGGRTVQYGTATAAPRLWVAFADVTPPVVADAGPPVVAGAPRPVATGAAPPVFGYLSGLVGEQPTLHVTDQRHLNWTRTGDRAEQLKRHGLAVWRDAQRTCQG